MIQESKKLKKVEAVKISNFEINTKHITSLEELGSELVLKDIKTLTIEIQGGKFIWMADSYKEDTIEPCNCNIMEVDEIMPECPACKMDIRLYRDRNVYHKNGIHYHGWCIS